ncbi:hypothetical protein L6452_02522 [Arctium lappa]|uniref:Uncharacterized protein n=1 Tax=Arctium lappa TaxID=4217 RepID=A0ACB9FJB0_ARCLA|nr:hypothetical protein L6452_02522 [Arctium lappa]
MAARYELELTISSAKNLKNINWRHGPLKPYAVVWVDPQNKCSTLVDEVGDESPVWDQKLVIPLNDLIQDSTLFIDIVHAKAAEEIKPLIGSAKLKLKDVVDEVGIGECFADGLKLKRPSGRPHGKVEVKVYIREPRYRAPDPYFAPPPYGVPPPQQYHAPPAYAAPYGGSPQYYDQAYGQQPGYGGEYKEEKKSKYGMGTGLAVGAAAGLLGGLAIAEGIDYVGDEIAEDAAEKVEEDLGYDDE